MRLQIDWASLIVGSEFTVFVLFYFVFEGNFSSTSPQGAYIWRGDLTEGFLRHRFGRPTFGGAYFRNFTGIFPGLSYNKASKMFLNSLRKNETEAQVEFTLKIIERATVGRMVAFRCD